MPPAASQAETYHQPPISTEKPERHLALVPHIGASALEHEAVATVDAGFTEPYFAQEAYQPPSLTLIEGGLSDAEQTDTETPVDADEDMQAEDLDTSEASAEYAATYSSGGGGGSRERVSCVKCEITVSRKEVPNHDKEWECAHCKDNRNKKLAELAMAA